MFAVDAFAQAQRLDHGGAIREVAQHVKRVATANAVVDGRDKPRVHLLDGIERTLVAAEDIAMAEMGVGGEPDHGDPFEEREITVGENLMSLM